MFGVGSSLFDRISGEAQDLVEQVVLGVTSKSNRQPSLDPIAQPCDISYLIPTPNLEYIAEHFAGLQDAPGTHPRLFPSRYCASIPHDHPLVDIMHDHIYFTGAQLIHWLVDRAYATTMSDALWIATSLLNHGFIATSYNPLTYAAIAASKDDIFYPTRQEYHLCYPYLPQYTILRRLYDLNTMKITSKPEDFELSARINGILHYQYTHAEAIQTHANEYNAQFGSDLLTAAAKTFPHVLEQPKQQLQQQDGGINTTAISVAGAPPPSRLGSISPRSISSTTDHSGPSHSHITTIVVPTTPQSSTIPPPVTPTAVTGRSRSSSVRKKVDEIFSFGKRSSMSLDHHPVIPPAIPQTPRDSTTSLQNAPLATAAGNTDVVSPSSSRYSLSLSASSSTGYNYNSVGRNTVGPLISPSGDHEGSLDEHEYDGAHSSPPHAMHRYLRPELDVDTNDDYNYSYQFPPHIIIQSNDKKKATTHSASLSVPGSPPLFGHIQPTDDIIDFIADLPFHDEYTQSTLNRVPMALESPRSVPTPHGSAKNSSYGDSHPSPTLAPSPTLSSSSSPVSSSHFSGSHTQPAKRINKTPAIHDIFEAPAGDFDLGTSQGGSQNHSANDHDLHGVRGHRNPKGEQSTETSSEQTENDVKPSSTVQNSPKYQGSRHTRTNSLSQLQPLHRVQDQNTRSEYVTPNLALISPHNDDNSGLSLGSEISPLNLLGSDEISLFNQPRLHPPPPPPKRTKTADDTLILKGDAYKSQGSTSTTVPMIPQSASLNQHRAKPPSPPSLRTINSSTSSSFRTLTAVSNELPPLTPSPTIPRKTIAPNSPSHRRTLSYTPSSQKLRVVQYSSLDDLHAAKDLAAMEDIRSTPLPVATYTNDHGSRPLSSTSAPKVNLSSLPAIARQKKFVGPIESESEHSRSTTTTTVTTTTRDSSSQSDANFSFIMNTPTVRRLFQFLISCTNSGHPLRGSIPHPLSSPSVLRRSLENDPSSSNLSQMLSQSSTTSRLLEHLKKLTTICLNLIHASKFLSLESIYTLFPLLTAQVQHQSEDSFRVIWQESNSYQHLIIPWCLLSAATRSNSSGQSATNIDQQQTTLPLDEIAQDHSFIAVLHLKEESIDALPPPLLQDNNNTVESINRSNYHLTVLDDHHQSGNDDVLSRSPSTTGRSRSHSSTMAAFNLNSFLSRYMDQSGRPLSSSLPHTPSSPMLSRSQSSLSTHGHPTLEPVFIYYLHNLSTSSQQQQSDDQYNSPYEASPQNLALFDKPTSFMDILFSASQILQQNGVIPPPVLPQSQKQYTPDVRPSSLKYMSPYGGGSDTNMERPQGTPPTSYFLCVDHTDFPAVESGDSISSSEYEYIEVYGDFIIPVGDEDAYEQLFIVEELSSTSSTDDLLDMTSSSHQQSFFTDPPRDCRGANDSLSPSTSQRKLPPPIPTSPQQHLDPKLSKSTSYFTYYFETSTHFIPSSSLTAIAVSNQLLLPFNTSQQHVINHTSIPSLSIEPLLSAWTESANNYFTYGTDPLSKPHLDSGFIHYADKQLLSQSSGIDLLSEDPLLHIITHVITGNHDQLTPAKATSVTHDLNALTSSLYPLQFPQQTLFLDDNGAVITTDAGYLPPNQQDFFQYDYYFDLPSSSSDDDDGDDAYDDDSDIGQGDTKSLTATTNRTHNSDDPLVTPMKPTIGAGKVDGKTIRRRRMKKSEYQYYYCDENGNEFVVEWNDNDHDEHDVYGSTSSSSLRDSSHLTKSFTASTSQDLITTCSHDYPSHGTHALHSPSTGSRQSRTLKPSHQQLEQQHHHEARKSNHSLTAKSGGGEVDQHRPTPAAGMHVLPTVHSGSYSPQQSPLLKPPGVGLNISVNFDDDHSTTDSSHLNGTRPGNRVVSTTFTPQNDQYRHHMHHILRQIPAQAIIPDETLHIPSSTPFPGADTLDQLLLQSISDQDQVSDSTQSTTTRKDHTTQPEKGTSLHRDVDDDIIEVNKHDHSNTSTKDSLHQEIRVKKYHRFELNVTVKDLYILAAHIKDTSPPEIRFVDSPDYAAWTQVILPDPILPTHHDMKTRLVDSPVGVQPPQYHPQQMVISPSAASMSTTTSYSHRPSTAASPLLTPMLTSDQFSFNKSQPEPRQHQRQPSSASQKGNKQIYSACFTGESLVHFIKDRLNLKHTIDAIMIANEMMFHGLLVHVPTILPYGTVDEHMKKMSAKTHNKKNRTGPHHDLQSSKSQTSPHVNPSAHTSQDGGVSHKKGQSSQKPTITTPSSKSSSPHPTPNSHQASSGRSSMGSFTLNKLDDNSLNDRSSGGSFNSTSTAAQYNPPQTPTSKVSSTSRSSSHQVNEFMTIVHVEGENDDEDEDDDDDNDDDDDGYENHHHADHYGSTYHHHDQYYSQGHQNSNYMYEYIAESYPLEHQTGHGAAENDFGHDDTAGIYRSTLSMYDHDDNDEYESDFQQYDDYIPQNTRSRGFSLKSLGLPFTKSKSRREKSSKHHQSRSRPSQQQQQQQQQQQLHSESGGSKTHQHWANGRRCRSESKRMHRTRRRQYDEYFITQLMKTFPTYHEKPIVPYVQPYQLVGREYFEILDNVYGENNITSTDQQTSLIQVIHTYNQELTQYLLLRDIIRHGVAIPSITAQDGHDGHEDNDDQHGGTSKPLREKDKGKANKKQGKDQPEQSLFIVDPITKMVSLHPKSAPLAYLQSPGLDFMTLSSSGDVSSTLTTTVFHNWEQELEQKTRALCVAMASITGNTNLATSSESYSKRVSQFFPQTLLTFQNSSSHPDPIYIYHDLMQRMVHQHLFHVAPILAYQSTLHHLSTYPRYQYEFSNSCLLYRIRLDAVDISVDVETLFSKFISQSMSSFDDSALFTGSNSSQYLHSSDSTIYPSNSPSLLMLPTSPNQLHKVPSLLQISKDHSQTTPQSVVPSYGQIPGPDTDFVLKNENDDGVHRHRTTATVTLETPDDFLTFLTQFSWYQQKYHQGLLNYDNTQFIEFLTSYKPLLQEIQTYSSTFFNGAPAFQHELIIEQLAFYLQVSQDALPVPTAVVEIPLSSTNSPPVRPMSMSSSSSSSPSSPSQSSISASPVLAFSAPLHESYVPVNMNHSDHFTSPQHHMLSSHVNYDDVSPYNSGKVRHHSSIDEEHDLGFILPTIDSNSGISSPHQSTSPELGNDTLFHSSSSSHAYHSQIDYDHSKHASLISSSSNSPSLLPPYPVTSPFQHRQQQYNTQPSFQPSHDKTPQKNHGQQIGHASSQFTASPHLSLTKSQYEETLFGSYNPPDFDVMKQSQPKEIASHPSRSAQLHPQDGTLAGRHNPSHTHDENKSVSGNATDASLTIVNSSKFINVPMYLIYAFLLSGPTDSMAHDVFTMIDDWYRAFAASQHLTLPLVAQSPEFIELVLHDFDEIDDMNITTTEAALAHNNNGNLESDSSYSFPEDDAMHQKNAQMSLFNSGNRFGNNALVADPDPISPQLPPKDLQHDTAAPQIDGLTLETTHYPLDFTHQPHGSATFIQNGVPHDVLLLLSTNLDFLTSSLSIQRFMGRGGSAQITSPTITGTTSFDSLNNPELMTFSPKMNPISTALYTWNDASFRLSGAMPPTPHLPSDSNDILRQSMLSIHHYPYKHGMYGTADGHDQPSISQGAASPRASFRSNNSLRILPPHLDQQHDITLLDLLHHPMLRVFSPMPLESTQTIDNERGGVGDDDPELKLSHEPHLVPISSPFLRPPQYTSLSSTTSSHTAVSVPSTFYGRHPNPQINRMISSLFNPVTGYIYSTKRPTRPPFSLGLDDMISPLDMIDKPHDLHAGRLSFHGPSNPMNQRQDSQYISPWLSSMSPEQHYKPLQHSHAHTHDDLHSHSPQVDDHIGIDHENMIKANDAYVVLPAMINNLGLQIVYEDNAFNRLVRKVLQTIIAIVPSGLPPSIENHYHPARPSQGHTHTTASKGSSTSSLHSDRMTPRISYSFTSLTSGTPRGSSSTAGIGQFALSPTSFTARPSIGHSMVFNYNNTLHSTRTPTQARGPHHNFTPSPMLSSKHHHHQQYQQPPFNSNKNLSLNLDNQHRSGGASAGGNGNGNDVLSPAMEKQQHMINSLLSTLTVDDIVCISHYIQILLRFIPPQIHYLLQQSEISYAQALLDLLTPSTRESVPLWIASLPMPTVSIMRELSHQRQLSTFPRVGIMDVDDIYWDFRDSIGEDVMYVNAAPSQPAVVESHHHNPYLGYDQDLIPLSSNVTPQPQQPESPNILFSPPLGPSHPNPLMPQLPEPLPLASTTVSSNSSVNTMQDDHLLALPVLPLDYESQSTSSSDLDDSDSHDDDNDDDLSDPSMGSTSHESHSSDSAKPSRERTIPSLVRINTTLSADQLSPQLESIKANPSHIPPILSSLQLPATGSGDYVQSDSNSNAVTPTPTANVVATTNSSDSSDDDSDSDMNPPPPPRRPASASTSTSPRSQPTVIPTRTASPIMAALVKLPEDSDSSDDDDDDDDGLLGFAPPPPPRRKTSSASLPRPSSADVDVTPQPISPPLSPTSRASAGQDISQPPALATTPSSQQQPHQQQQQQPKQPQIASPVLSKLPSYPPSSKNLPGSAFEAGNEFVPHNANAAVPSHHTDESTPFTKGALPSTAAAAVAGEEHHDTASTLVPTEPPEDLRISCLSFSQTGEFIAIGDRGGNITVVREISHHHENRVRLSGYGHLFDNTAESTSRGDEPFASAESAAGTTQSSSSQYNPQSFLPFIGVDGKTRLLPPNSNVEYRIFSEFSSHQEYIDILMNDKIPPDINQIRFLPQDSGKKQVSLLSSNRTTIKLWRLTEHEHESSHISGRPSWNEFINRQRGEQSQPRYRERYMNHQYNPIGADCLMPSSVHPHHETPSGLGMSILNEQYTDLHNRSKQFKYGTNHGLAQQSADPILSLTSAGYPWKSSSSLLSFLLTPHTNNMLFQPYSNTRLYRSQVGYSSYTAPPYGPSGVSQSNQSTSLFNQILGSPDNGILGEMKHGYSNPSPSAYPQSSQFYYSLGENQDNISRVRPKLLHTYRDAHRQPIHSVSLGADQQSFLSADWTTVNLWSIDHEDAYKIVDYQPTTPGTTINPKDVITCVRYHNQQPSLYTIGGANGTVKLCDLRVKALQDDPENGPYTVFDGKKMNYSYFNASPRASFRNLSPATRDIISGIQDIQFSSEGYYMFTRDFMTVKTWDIRYNKHPIQEFHVNDWIGDHVDGLTYNPSIYDQHSIAISPDNRQLLTGSFLNSFCMINLELPDPFTGLPPSVSPQDLVQMYSSNVKSIEVSQHDTPIIQKDDDNIHVQSLQQRKSSVLSSEGDEVLVKSDPTRNHQQLIESAGFPVPRATPVAIVNKSTLSSNQQGNSGSSGSPTQTTSSSLSPASLPHSNDSSPFHNPSSFGSNKTLLSRGSGGASTRISGGSSGNATPGSKGRTSSISSLHESILLFQQQQKQQPSSFFQSIQRSINQPQKYCTLAVSHRLPTITYITFENRTPPSNANSNPVQHIASALPLTNTNSTSSAHSLTHDSLQMVAELPPYYHTTSPQLRTTLAKTIMAQCQFPQQIARNVVDFFLFSVAYRPERALSACTSQEVADINRLFQRKAPKRKRRKESLAPPPTDIPIGGYSSPPTDVDSNSNPIQPPGSAVLQALPAQRPGESRPASSTDAKPSKPKAKSLTERASSLFSWNKKDKKAAKKSPSPPDIAKNGHDNSSLYPSLTGQSLPGSHMNNGAHNPAGNSHLTSGSPKHASPRKQRPRRYKLTHHARIYHVPVSRKRQAHHRSLSSSSPMFALNLYNSYRKSFTMLDTYKKSTNSHLPRKYHIDHLHSSDDPRYINHVYDILSEEDLNLNPKLDVYQLLRSQSPPSGVSIYGNVFGNMNKSRSNSMELMLPSTQYHHNHSLHRTQSLRHSSTGGGSTQLTQTQTGFPKNLISPSDYFYDFQQQVNCEVDRHCQMDTFPAPAYLAYNNAILTVAFHPMNHVFSLSSKYRVRIYQGKSATRRFIESHHQQQQHQPSSQQPSQQPTSSYVTSMSRYSSTGTTTSATSTAQSVQGLSIAGKTVHKPVTELHINQEPTSGHSAVMSSTQQQSSSVLPSSSLYDNGPDNHDTTSSFISLTPSSQQPREQHTSVSLPLTSMASHDQLHVPLTNLPSYYERKRPPSPSQSPSIAPNTVISHNTFLSRHQLSSQLTADVLDDTLDLSDQTPRDSSSQEKTRSSSIDLPEINFTYSDDHIDVKFYENCDEDDDDDDEDTDDIDDDDDIDDPIPPPPPIRRNRTVSMSVSEQDAFISAPHPFQPPPDPEPITVSPSASQVGAVAGQQPLQTKLSSTHHPPEEVVTESVMVITTPSTSTHSTTILPSGQPHVELVLPTIPMDFLESDTSSPLSTGHGSHPLNDGDDQFDIHHHHHQSHNSDDLLESAQVAPLPEIDLILSRSSSAKNSKSGYSLTSLTRSASSNHRSGHRRSTGSSGRVLSRENSANYDQTQQLRTALGFSSILTTSNSPESIANIPIDDNNSATSSSLLFGSSSAQSHLSSSSKQNQPEYKPAQSTSSQMSGGSFDDSEANIQ